MTEQGGQERTEAASPERLREARKEGQVARSNDLSTALVLLLAFGVLLRAIPSFATMFKAQVVEASQLAARPMLAADDLTGFLARSVAACANELVPVIVVLCAAALLFPFLQVGPLVALAPLAPKLERIDPIAGLKRTLFNPDAAVGLVKVSAKIIVVALVCWNAIASELPALLSLGSMPFESAAQVALAVAQVVAVRSLLCFVAFGVLDLLYQRWRHGKRMRMTKAEVKQEHKQQEGDPHYKQARKRMHEEIAFNTMMVQVRQSDGIVAEQERVACALRYRPLENSAPRMVAKGRGAIAQRIREVAHEEGIPIVHEVGLANALHQLELDSEIPEELYDATIEVMRWLEQAARAEGREAGWTQPSAAQNKS